VKAATGEEVGVEELGGADMHTRVSGTADYPAASEPEAIAIARDVVAQWRRPTRPRSSGRSPSRRTTTRELYGSSRATSRSSSTCAR
jgi:3-methylcrotonyl-CoA carboxylase beta subunit